MVGVTVDSRATAATGSRGQLFFVTVWLAVTLVLVVASQVVSAPQALGDEDLDARFEAAADFPLTGPDPTVETDPSIVYAGMLWTLDEARIADVEDGLFGRTSIEVDVTVTNTLVATELRIPESMVALVADEAALDAGAAGDGVAPRFVDAGRRLTVAPGEDLAVTIEFEVYDPEPTLERYTLRIAEPNRAPAFIRLGGEQEPGDYPVLAAVDTSPLTTSDPTDSGRQIVVEPVAASVDVNAGPYRAAVDEELAVVKIEVQRTLADDGAAYLDNGYWALEVDGERVLAILVARSGETASNTDEVTLLFAFPAEPDDLTVVGAAGADDEISFSVVLPS